MRVGMWGRSFYRPFRCFAPQRPAYYKELPLRGMYPRSGLYHIVLKHKFVLDADDVVQLVALGTGNGGKLSRDVLSHIVFQ